MSQMTLFNVSATRCQRCGRVLTDPTSVQRGIGPVCAALENAENERSHEQNFDDHYIAEPIKPNGLVMRRDDGGVWTKVPHVVTYHSPTGYEWGYSGSGPADLALNIIEIALHTKGYNGPRIKCFDGTCYKLAFELHKEFKQRYIAIAPREGGRLPWDVIDNWLTEHMP